MIDLRNTCVLIRTKEENEMFLNEVEKQGFHWFGYSNCKPFYEQYFPDILKLYNDRSMADGSHINSDYTFYEAAELLGTKEMTAREFAEWIADVSNCVGRKCSECILDEMNTEGSCNLCNTGEWKGNIDELLEIALLSRTTILSPEEKAIDTIEKFIKNPDRETLNDDFVDALKLAVEKLKKGKVDGEINT